MMMTHRMMLKTHPLCRHTFAHSIRSHSAAVCKRRKGPESATPHWKAREPTREWKRGLLSCS